MKTRTYILATIVFASIPFLSQITFAGAGGDSEPPKPEVIHPELFKLHLIKKSFTCGNAELTTESACFFSTDAVNQQCRKQTIRLVNSKKGISRKLSLDGKLVKKNFKESPGPVLDTVVTSVGCLKSKTGKHFITLYYVCNWGRDCYGTNKESQKYFTVDVVNLSIRKLGDFKKYGIPETGGTYVDITSTSAD
jgi:hypothetical protein